MYIYYNFTITKKFVSYFYMEKATKLIKKNTLKLIFNKLCK